ncbi:MAG: translocation/assembly module TamB domain-containing protein, partial [Providencia sp.]|nr:translocation/assembly module TamB domain-containing protein [Providencia sp.]
MHALVDMNIQTHGNFQNPTMTGNITLRDGVFQNRLLGHDVQNIRSEIQITESGQSSLINFESLHFETDGLGEFNFTGYTTAIFNLKNVSFTHSNDFAGFLEITDTDLNAVIRNLQLLYLPEIRSNVSGNINITNSSLPSIFPNADNIIVLPDLIMTGDILSNHLRINIDQFQRTITVPEPILVTAMREYTGEVVIYENNDTIFTIPGIDVNMFVNLPRNVFIHGRDMFIELRGETRLLVNNSEPFIDGHLELVRGHFFYLGQRFDLSEGLITFLGHEVDNPLISIRADYSFRRPATGTAREEGRPAARETISLVLEGHLQSPEITFLWNNQYVDEHDVVSLILTGRTVDELMG